MTPMMEGYLNGYLRKEAVESPPPQPEPARGIDAAMSRLPDQNWFSEEWRQRMDRIRDAAWGRARREAQPPPPPQPEPAAQPPPPPPQPEPAAQPPPPQPRSYGQGMVDFFKRVWRGGANSVSRRMPRSETPARGPSTGARSVNDAVRQFQRSSWTA